MKIKKIKIKKLKEIKKLKRIKPIGFNRDTILKKEVYCGKTAQEVLEKLNKEE